MAVDSGILVKCGREVLVSTRHAAVGADLGAVRQTIAEQYRRLDEHDRGARVHPHQRHACSQVLASDGGGGGDRRRLPLERQPRQALR
jgi:hypothetical protein